MGSCNSFICAASNASSAPAVLPSELGTPFTPSSFAFPGGSGPLIAGAAAESFSDHIAGAGLHLLLGMPATHPDAIAASQRCSGSHGWTVVPGQTHDAYLRIDSGKGRVFSPTELCSVLLRKLVAPVVSQPGGTVNAVLAVPVPSTDSFRAEARSAAQKAGINLMRIVCEPTMVGIAHGADKVGGGERRLVVFDLGGTKLDLSLLAVEDGVFEIINTIRNYEVGGMTFDAVLAEHCVSEIAKKYGTDISHNENMKRQLKESCRKAKHTLSSAVQAEVTIEGTELSLTVTRSTLDSISAGLYAKIEGALRQLITESKLSGPEAIDQIIMVGGSSRIPRIQGLVKEFFKRDPSLSASPETDVALGAAMLAQRLLAPPPAFFSCSPPSAPIPDTVGLYVKDGDPKTSIPLENVEWDVRIVESMMELTVSQTYANKSDSAVEALYVFPVEGDMAVTGLSVQINDKVLEARIKEKNRAEAVYEDAVASGNTGYLMSYDVGQKDIVRVCVGNLLPGRKAVVKISLAQMLTSLGEENSLSFSIPESFTPRYHSATLHAPAALAESPILCPPSQLPYGWSVDARLESGSRIAKIKCSYGIKIEYNADQTKAHAILADKNALLEKDFVLEYWTEKSKEPRVILQKDPSFPQYAAAVTFCPEFATEPKQAAGEYIFVLDCSGSMGGRRIDLTKEAASSFIGALPRGSSYNVYLFGSDFLPFFPVSVPISDQARLKETLQRLANVYAEMGGTEMLPPLTHIFSSEAHPNLPRNVFLLTDGGVSNESAITALVKLHKGNTRVHTFGIGDGVSTSLIKNVARAGAGKYEFVRDDEPVAAKVLAQLAKVSKPAMSVTELVWPSGWEIIRTTLANTVYAGEPFTVLALCRGVSSASGSARLVAVNNVDGEKRCFEAKVCGPVLDGGLLYRIAARRIMCDYDLKEKEEIELATQFSVLSEHTAFVVVEKQTAPASGEVKTIRVPVPAPARYSMSDILLLDVSPLTLGVEGLNGNFVPIIDRNSTIPCRRSHKVTVACDPAKGSCCVRVYEGCRTMVKDNNFLDQLVLPSPATGAKTVELDVTMDLSADNLLSVSANGSSSIVIRNDGKGRLTKAEIDEMIMEAEALKDEDEKVRLRVEARNLIETVCHRLRELLDGLKLGTELKKVIAEMISGALKWMEEKTRETAELTLRLAEMGTVMMPVLEKLWAENGSKLPFASLAELGSPQPTKVQSGTSSGVKRTGPSIEDVD